MYNMLAPNDKDDVIYNIAALQGDTLGISSPGLLEMSASSDVIQTADHEEEFVGVNQPHEEL